ncbi:MAG TPA: cyanophycin synthetase, partial [Thermomicrobiales bacterium]|nr:cyanophycin synthetase [Thermomicrobiales bacterium]
LPSDGLAVLNIDDPRVQAMAERAGCRVVYYGTDPKADYFATDLESRGIEGISFTLHHSDVQSFVSVPLMGRHSVHMALVGIAVGTELGMSLADILRGFQTPDIQLRLLLLPGVNGSTLLDDSYNANPASCIAALNLLVELDTTRRVAVFGDMYELGSYEEEGHRLVGGRAAETVDALYTMGPRARLIAAEAVKARPDLPVEMFDDKRALEDALRRDLRPGDLVLIKGSRGLELETLVAALRTETTGETD